MKSASNKDKHGIDFVEAQELWADSMLIEVPARTEDAPRFLVVGRLSGKHWSAVCVRRESATRIVSVRRARKMEIQAYEGG